MPATQYQYHHGPLEDFWPVPRAEGRHQGNFEYPQGHTTRLRETDRLSLQVGNALGLGGTHNSGQTERYEGRGEYDASRAQGYTQGAGDRVTGKKDSVVGSATGDHSQQHSGELNL